MSADRPPKPPPHFDGQRDTWEDMRPVAAQATADPVADEDTSDDLSGLDPLAFDALGAAAELDAALAEDTDHGDNSIGSSESYIALLEAEADELNTLVAKKNERIAELEAEAERARARIERAAQKDTEQHTRKIVLGFIDVLDDLDRAVAAAGQAVPGSAVLEGVELVRKRFLARLAELDVHHVPALNAPFDPNQHEAMSVVTTTDPAQDGLVIGVMREGYRIGNDTLRPAGVAVGKHVPAQP
jgi:molecular chaperone GrpE